MESYFFLARESASSRLNVFLAADGTKWSSFNESLCTPTACTSHSMTACGEFGIILFGGQGRKGKLSNLVYRLDPVTCTFSQLKTSGVRCWLPKQVILPAFQTSSVLSKYSRSDCIWLPEFFSMPHALHHQLPLVPLGNDLQACTW